MVSFKMNRILLLDMKYNISRDLRIRLRDTLVDARDVRTNTPKPGTGILFGSVGSDVMLSIASRRKVYEDDIK